MYSAQMREPIMQGTNGLHPRNFASIPLHKSKSNLCPFYQPQSPGYWRHQAVDTTPCPKDEVLQAPRCHDLSSKRLMQKYRMPSEHTVHQTDVSKHGTSTTVNQQNFCPQGGVMNNASGPQRSQGLYKLCLQKAHCNAVVSKPCGKDDQGRDRRTRACHVGPGQGTAAVVVSPGAANTQSNGCQLPGAPPTRPIPLPGRQEGDEQIYYGYGRGAAPGIKLMGAVQVDNVLSPLDMALPVPFS